MPGVDTHKGTTDLLRPPTDQPTHTVHFWHKLTFTSSPHTVWEATELRKQNENTARALLMLQAWRTYVLCKGLDIVFGVRNVSLHTLYDLLDRWVIGSVCRRTRMVWHGFLIDLNLCFKMSSFYRSGIVFVHFIALCIAVIDEETKRRHKRLKMDARPH